MKYLYKIKKEEARQKAQNIQLLLSENAVYWADIIDNEIFLNKLGKRYGLIKEFKREGLI